MDSIILLIRTRALNGKKLEMDEMDSLLTSETGWKLYIDFFWLIKIPVSRDFFF